MYLLKVAIIAITYTVLAQMSVRFGTIAGQVSPIWLP